MTPRILMSFAVALACSPTLAAGEILLRADRDRITQGESLQVSITVKGSTVNPVIVPPSVPYCQIELVEHASVRPAGQAQPDLHRSGPPGNMTRSIVDLERQLQGMIGKLDKQGFGDSPLLREYDGMLRDIRRQAVEALNSKPGPRQYQAVYRVTPQRAGTLTLSPFSVRIGNQTLLTNSLTITIDPPSAMADSSPPAAGLAEPSMAAAEPPPQGQRLKLCYWALVVLLAPLLGAVLFLLRSRHGPRPAPALPTRPVVDWRQEAMRLGEATTADDIARCLTAYLRVRCELPEGEVTPLEAADALRRAGMDDSLADRFAEVLEACYAARFAPERLAVAEAALFHEARRLAGLIDRKLPLRLV
jgi:hypothetical protein